MQEGFIFKYMTISELEALIYEIRSKRNVGKITSHISVPTYNCLITLVSFPNETIYYWTHISPDDPIMTEQQLATFKENLFNLVPDFRVSDEVEKDIPGYYGLVLDIEIT
jgi:hypothetical protein|nr:MAG TPA: hypothetical protein [Caudoviricetes sp.]DAQ55943.1 MAG TPA: hypothetical protein [Caudoviricetes sp.]